MKRGYPSRHSAALIVASVLLLTPSIGISQGGLPWRKVQDLPAFDVASVKPTGPKPVVRPNLFTSSGFAVSNTTVRELIREAYGLTVTGQVRGGPDWIDSLRFDIDAKAPGAEVAQMRLMLQKLLIERFALDGEERREDAAVFALTLARKDRRLGPKLTSLPNGCEPPSGSSSALVERFACGQVMALGAQLLARGITMARFAEVLSRSEKLTGIDRLVIDRTGLSGMYQLDIQYLPPETPGLRKSDSPELLQDLHSALSDQLGLKLEPTRAQVQVILIHRVDRPTAN